MLLAVAGQGSCALTVDVGRHSTWGWLVEMLLLLLLLLLLQNAQQVTASSCWLWLLLTGYCVGGLRFKVSARHYQAANHPFPACLSPFPPPLPTTQCAACKPCLPAITPPPPRAAAEADDRKLMGAKWMAVLTFAFVTTVYFKRWKWSPLKSRRIIVDVVN